MTEQLMGRAWAMCVEDISVLYALQFQHVRRQTAKQERVSIVEAGEIHCRRCGS